MHLLQMMRLHPLAVYIVQSPTQSHSSLTSLMYCMTNSILTPAVCGIKYLCNIIGPLLRHLLCSDQTFYLCPHTDVLFIIRDHHIFI